MNRWNQCSYKERPYLNQRQVLCVENEIILKGTNPVIPETLRRKVIEAAHATHPGTRATNHILQKEAWWPNLSRDVEEFVRQCPQCNKVKPKKIKVLDKWPEETQAWNRVHMDHAHIPQIGTFLILVDAYSGYPEVARVNDRSVSSTINALRNIFAHHGVPWTLVSDNAAEFTSEEFTKWLHTIGCRPYKTPPYHPQSNGIAERMVKTIKDAMKMWQQQWGNFNGYLSKVLLAYRAIPHGNRTVSASALMGRQIRMPIMCSNTLTPCTEVIYNGEKAKIVVQKGSNTYIVKKLTGKAALMAHEDQLKVIMEEEEENDQEVQERRLQHDGDANAYRRSQRLANKDKMDYRLLNTGR